MLQMTERRESLVRLLREAGRAHHQAFIEVAGEDAGWPVWYAGWLAPRLGGLLDVDTQRLARALEEAEEERQEYDPRGDWPGYYADWLIARFSVRHPARVG